MQHFLHHLAPRGRAGFVLANGSMSSSQSGEGEIRRRIVEAGLVDCIVALPGQLFRSTQIPACLWFLSRDRSSTASRNETLFIDARKLGHMIDRTRRDLSAEDIARVANTYHAWHNQTLSGSSPSPSMGEGRGEGDPAPSPSQGEGRGGGPPVSEGESAPYTDSPGFCKSATIEEIRKHGHVLTPEAATSAPRLRRTTANPSSRR